MLLGPSASIIHRKVGNNILGTTDFKNTPYWVNKIWSSHTVEYCMLSCFDCVQLFATLWTVVLQASVSLGLLQARILEWVAMHSPRGSSPPRGQTHISLSLRCQAGSLPLLPLGEPTMEYYSAIKRNKVLTHAIPWMNLENIMLSEEARQERTNPVWFYLYGRSNILGRWKSSENSLMGEG